MKQQLKEEIVEDLKQRFISYAKVNTQSNEDNSTCPSTPGQMTLAHQLVKELNEIGMEDVTVDPYGYVMATLPSNTEKEIPVIGFLAHLDTSPDSSGENVSPQIVENYDGQEILLNAALGVKLSPADFPNLHNYKGHTLITTDGTTLLGADDKAGIAEIMTAMHYLIKHPEIKHGKIRVAFTPDEEIGRGPEKFDVAAFGATYAYTVDGGPVGELEYESFNAAAATLTFQGVSVHPGTAKNKMVNASKLAMEFHSLLPTAECPEQTEGYEGFYHLTDISGNVEAATLKYIIRDFDRTAFEQRKALIEQTAKQLQAKYGEHTITVQIKDTYYNMREKIEPVFEIVEIAKGVLEALNITPIIQPIRGGTDGSQLSYMGLPTPNIFTGGENYHGKYEFVSLDNMVLATHVVIDVIKRFEAQG
ncbi:tripeptide aminopeptidase [Paenibacillus turicensis]|uniref:Peptidase T n=1 Tax=Paenibacillus turicensis TaxID=160487 RepID=A0ABS4FSA7_9BACL|nr:tripeptide aminopeptidase [Paenibacillus turicensis]